MVYYWASKLMCACAVCGYPLKCLPQLFNGEGEVVVFVVLIMIVFSRFFVQFQRRYLLLCVCVCVAYVLSKQNRKL